jgi:DNA adenine methylase
VIPTRPVLRWHGGKWILAPWIIDHFPPHRVYTEAFGGAASVLIRKPRSHAEVYNDLDGDVVNFFRVLQDEEQSKRLLHLLAVTPFARAEFERAYEPTEDLVERARRMAIVSLMGFGSNAHNRTIRTGFRAASNLSGTTPGRDWDAYPRGLRQVIERLKGVVIENRPAADVLSQHDGPETLHFVDPPYVHATRSALKRKDRSEGVRGLYRHEMSDGDHRDLAKLLHSLRGGVVLCGYPSPLYDEDLFKGWHRVQRTALADGALERTEVLWINEAAWAGGGRLL